ncbi:two-component system response regulator YesN [Hydrogenispora ethanolica]|uniref:Two-component system response regulator YesN n=1 Tax=Hydrogenispora ethanolica TaxID=1082276 RepID=A0A4R1RJJ8_HYDET|nr:response regulator [Hydrogenispora ethanolica]TCL65970.1 two-component system response regulator YesN [Hydrogenispora ethanolica]
MMRVLVADDEQIMLDALAKVLTPKEGVELATARSGREAIEIAESFRPDLVMMDIKMPGINGLEALAEIRRFNPHTVLVILSAYDNFNYAQEAIRLAVFDYLLKPINKTRMMEMIHKVQAHLDGLRAARQEELALRERYKKLLPLIENEFLHALQNGIDRPALAEYQELLGIDFQYGFFLAVLYSDDSYPATGEMEEKYLVREKLEELAEGIRHLFPCLVGPVKTNPITVFVPLSRLEGDGAATGTLYANKILEYFRNERGITRTRIGVGGIHESPASLGRSYQEAMLALNFPSDNPICCYETFRRYDAADWESELRQQLQEIAEAVRFGHLYRTEILLNRLAARYGGVTVPERHILLGELLELLLSTFRLVRENAKIAMAYPSPDQLLTWFATDQTTAAIIQNIAGQILALTHKIKDGRESQVKAVILQAKEQIDRMYQEDLSLDDLAQAVSVSPFYLSRLFREELGVSFTEYITKLRLEKALTLLAEGFPVKECCFAVGYNDPNYFSRLFRKYYHLSPTEYRDEALQRKERLSQNE